MWLLSTALAVPVLYGPEVPERKALARAAEATGLDPEQLEPTTLDALVTHDRPVLVGDGSMALCGGAPTRRADVEAHLEKARGALNYMETAEASVHLEKVDAALTCLSEPVDVSQASEAYFLWGMVATSEGRPDRAVDHFVQARLFDPSLVWDEAASPTARPHFEAAGERLTTQAPASLRFLPGLGTLSIDGVERTVSEDRLLLGPGRHLLQFDATTLMIELPDGGDGSLVMPSRLEPGFVDTIDADRDPVATVLGALVGKGQLVVVVTPMATWRGSTGSSAWERLEGEALDTAVPLPEPPPGLSPLTKAGAGTLVGAAAVYGAAYAVNRSFYDEDTPRENLDTLQSVNNGLVIGAGALAVVGLGLGVAGVF